MLASNMSFFLSGGNRQQLQSVYGLYRAIEGMLQATDSLKWNQFGWSSLLIILPSLLWLFPRPSQYHMASLLVSVTYPGRTRSGLVCSLD